MATPHRARRSSPKRWLLQKPQGQITARVQEVGPEHFGVMAVDCAKARSKFLLADFYANVLIPPTVLPHTRGDFHAAIERVRQAMAQHDLRDVIVAVERTGEYHRPVQRAFREASFEVRLVHPFASKQFRLPADPSIKTDDTDLAGIFRAAVNGFGLLEPVLPDDYQKLQLLIRHRRDLVRKSSALRCQIREQLHAMLPGYADCFGDGLWSSPVALPVARQVSSPQAIRAAGVDGLRQIIAANERRCRAVTLHKVLAWTDTAPPAHPHGDFLRDQFVALDDDRLQKARQIQGLERLGAHLLVHTPYLLLMAIPGINVVSAADFAGEMGPITHYANANAITGRAGLMPSRYQSDRVDRPDGPVRRCANRRLRHALLTIADDLIACNHHFHARADLWKQAGKDPRWIRIKVAKSFSRLAFAMVASRALFRHPSCRQRHYILDKLLAFHAEHDTPMPEQLRDLQAAVEQLPGSAHAEEAKPLAERLQEAQASRRGPQPLAAIIPIVLARLGIHQLQCSSREGRDLS